MQLVKVAQVMLSAGNEKFNAAAKQLADIILQKDNLLEAAPATGEAENGKASAVAVPTPRALLRLATYYVCIVCPKICSEIREHFCPEKNFFLCLGLNLFSPEFGEFLSYWPERVFSPRGPFIRP